MANVRRAFEKRQARSKAWVKAVELVGLSLVEIVLADQADEVLVPRSLREVGGFTLTSRPLRGPRQH
jgi:hypothetical protein